MAGFVHLEFDTRFLRIESPNYIHGPWLCKDSLRDVEAPEEGGHLVVRGHPGKAPGTHDARTVHLVVLIPGTFGIVIQSLNVANVVLIPGTFRIVNKTLLWKVSFIFL